MNLRRSLGIIGLVAFGALGGASCDIIIGIEDLSTPAATACTSPDDCPEAGNPCYIRACAATGYCEIRERDAGTVTDDQVAGDCLIRKCNQAGEPVDEIDDSDVPNEPNPCVTRFCSEGVVTGTYVLPGETCLPGRICDGGGQCVGCIDNTDCTGQQNCDTTTHECTAPTCNNMTKDGDETGPDCGGSCPKKCAVGQGCALGTDCASGVCGGNKTCAQPSCTDNVKNGNETGKDCGGNTTCTRCPDGQGCASDTDCQSQYCSLVTAPFQCATPTCMDGVMNGDETSEDCGPSCSHTCPNGAMCTEDSQCVSNRCDPDTATCVQN
ncbi:MAG: hypothetical protein U0271_02160 [Polyangiaceae bacterium]